ncbi:MAG TPA: class I SAM-dependent methyltransferase [Solirubrobacteraceae bacterium]|nr:class I SAM-dependent methyltransferase [Solirubrobacteraceae bacterium]
MSLFYKAAYRLGVTPWERAAEHPAAADQIAALFDREQEGREAPYGEALDLGCGGGIWAVELARRGWRVTGIDIVSAAVERARQRAREAGVEVRFLEGDVTALREAGVGSEFRFVWDFGTVHGLTPQQRESVGREVTAVTAPDASIVMLAWSPGRRGPLPRGMDRADVAATYGGWKVVDEEPFDASGLPKPLRGVDPRAYRLRRE